MAFNVLLQCSYRIVYGHRHVEFATISKMVASQGSSKKRILRGSPAGNKLSERQIKDTLISLKTAYNEQESEGSFWEVFKGASLKDFLIGGGLVLFRQSIPTNNWATKHSLLCSFHPSECRIFSCTKVAIVIGIFKARLVHEKMEEMLSQSVSDGGISLIVDEVVDRVLWKRPGYVNGLGHGPKPTSTSSSTSQTVSSGPDPEVISLWEIVESQQDTINRMASEQAALKQMVEQLLSLRQTSTTFLTPSA